MRYQIIDHGDYGYGLDADDARFGVIDTQHELEGQKVVMAKVISQYLNFEHAQILCDGLNAKEE